MILFDLDGTLTDSKKGITKAVRYALNKFQIEVSDLSSLEKFIGPPLAESFVNFYGFSERDSHLAVKYYREYFSETGLFENEVFEGVYDLLKKLQSRNIRMAIATAKPTVFAEQILDYFQLRDFFEFVAGSNLDGSRVQKVDVIKFALDNLPQSKEGKTIMIGDRKHDISGAKALGLPSIAVLYGYGSSEELKEAGADFLVANVEELSDLLLGMEF